MGIQPISSLGIYAPRFSDPDPLYEVYAGVRPEAQIPKWVHCPTRLGGKSVLGLPRCKGLLCPYCHPKRQRLLRRELNAIFKGVHAAGLMLSWVTLTRAHPGSEPLSVGMAEIRDLWSRARDGSPYRRLRMRYGLVGVITVLEVTWSSAGWHAHFHSVIATKGQKAAALGCAAALAQRFEDAIERRRIDPTHAATFDLVRDPAGLAGYLSKDWFERHKDGGLPPLKLLAQAYAGCKLSAALFVEAAEAMARKQRVTISPDLRKLILNTGAVQ